MFVTHTINVRPKTVWMILGNVETFLSTMTDVNLAPTQIATITNILLIAIPVLIEDHKAHTSFSISPSQEIINLLIYN
jgi:hypothetical protein